MMASANCRKAILPPIAALLTLATSGLSAAPLPGQAVAAPTMAPAPAPTGVSAPPGMRPAPAPTGAGQSGGGLGGATMMARPCAMTAGAEVLSVNGRKSGIIFTPGGAYQIRGCNLGSATGAAQLAAYRYGYGEMSVPLIVDTWSDTLIQVHIDANFGGVPDVGVNVNVTPVGGTEVGLQAANTFRSVKVERTICLPIGSGKVVYGGGGHTRACDGQFSTISRPLSASAEDCPGAMTGRTDTYDLDEVNQRGFDLLGVTNGNGLMNGAIPYLTMNGPEKVIVNLPTEWDGQRGACMSIYHLGVEIRGPRGVDPYPDPVQNVD